MRPGARLQAAIEILDLIDGGNLPVDDVLRGYFKTRRYAGSGDRRAVGETVFATLRNRGALDWRLHQAGLAESSRLRVALQAGTQTVQPLVDEPHFTAAPDNSDSEALRRAEVLDLAGAPDAARLNLPDWLIEQARPSFGDDWQAEIDAALSGRAATDLRVNTLQADRTAVAAALASDGIETEVISLVPHGLRLSHPVRLQDHALYQQGAFEIQDAGSQLVGHLVGARPGERVADICAGAGGKTLLLAADMAGEGTLVASDSESKRLDRLSPRVVKAGARNIVTEPVAADAPWPDGWAGSFDRVLVDAPCSGSGTWRRQPEQRWRLTPARLDELVALQQAILARAAQLVRPGGTLVYVTCSFLMRENETAITEFTATCPAFRVRNLAETQADISVLNGFTTDRSGPGLRISTLKHGTDSFFAADLSRRMD